MEHARRKNCTAYASQCHEPQRLVYHCVINEYANQTLEVCAYGRIIVSDPGCFKLAKGTSKKPGMETTQSTFTIVSSNSPYQTNGVAESFDRLIN
uniref:Uncharacterized protein n=1 Tax=Magallana gigas TaxID=29159 RepID=K1QTY3_MAGGI